jgi:hypothetical protein
MHGGKQLVEKFGRNHPCPCARSDAAGIAACAAAACDSAYRLDHCRE